MYRKGKKLGLHNTFWCSYLQGDKCFYPLINCAINIYSATCLNYEMVSSVSGTILKDRAVTSLARMVLFGSRTIRISQTDNY